MILLDTHAVIWLFGHPQRLSHNARAAIEQARAEAGVAIAAVTLFELAHLVARRRIAIERPIEEFLSLLTERFVLKPITIAIAVASAQFTLPYPGDPIDRLIGATALVEGIPLVTADERIRQSGQIQTIW